MLLTLSPSQGPKPTRGRHAHFTLAALIGPGEGTCFGGPEVDAAVGRNVSRTHCRARKKRADRLNKCSVPTLTHNPIE
jgi:hypothetical protein